MRTEHRGTCSCGTRCISENPQHSITQLFDDATSVAMDASANPISQLSNRFRCTLIAQRFVQRNTARNVSKDDRRKNSHDFSGSK